MTLEQVRLRAKSSTNIHSLSLSDADYNAIIRSAVFDVAYLLNNYGHTYYKKRTDFSIDTGTVTNMSAPGLPISEDIYSLIYAYAVDVNGNTYQMTCTTVEAVAEAEFNELDEGYVSYSKTHLFIHSPAGIPATYTLVTYYYSNPDEPATDSEDIDVPADFISYLINIIRKQIYQSCGLPLPQEIESEIYKRECELKDTHRRLEVREYNATYLSLSTEV